MNKIADRGSGPLVRALAILKCPWDLDGNDDLRLSVFLVLLSNWDP